MIAWKNADIQDVVIDTLSAEELDEFIRPTLRQRLDALNQRDREFDVFPFYRAPKSEIRQT